MWLLLAIRIAECNIWCLSESYDGGYYKAKSCYCVAIYDYDLVKLKKKKTIKFSEQSQEPEESYDSPYLKIK